MIATAAAAAFCALVVASPASAHDQLVASDPAADSAVDTLPAEMTLVYSGELIDAGDGNAVEVIAPSGDDVAGDISLDGTDVTVPLEGGEAGDYTVTWRVVSSDGHPVDGTFGFSVENGAPQDDQEAQDGLASDDAEQQAQDEEGDAAETAPEPSAAAPDDDAAADAESPFPSAAPWIIIGIVALAGGGAVVALLVGRTRRLGGDGPSSDRDPSSGPDGR